MNFDSIRSGKLFQDIPTHCEGKSDNAVSKKVMSIFSRQDERSRRTATFFENPSRFRIIKAAIRGPVDMNRNSQPGRGRSVRRVFTGAGTLQKKQRMRTRSMTNLRYRSPDTP
jgi:hypothetical protein